jgi:hypothetical protein
VICHWVGNNIHNGGVVFHHSSNYFLADHIIALVYRYQDLSSMASTMIVLSVPPKGKSVDIEFAERCNKEGEVTVR